MESRTSKQKEMLKSVQSVLSETLSYPAMSIPNRGAVQTARGDGQVAVRDACFVGQRCLALLMSADAMWRYLSLGRRNWDASGILMTAKGKTRHKGKARWRGARRATRGCRSVTWPKLLGSARNHSEEAEAGPYLTLPTPSCASTDSEVSIPNYFTLALVTCTLFT